jgi:hypothetical protein
LLPIVRPFLRQAVVDDIVGFDAEGVLDDLGGVVGEASLAQFVAIDDCARNARHVEEDAALDKRVYPRVAEQD